MDLDLLLVPGGVGLFLMGMKAMSEGLRALAGDGLRAGLARVAGSPLRGVAAGAAATALIQSSSATTLMTVGFVGAGLMSFQQALGVVLGANIGTTVTGWIVAVAGFKLDLGAVAMPLLFAAMMLRLFAGGRAAQAGWALGGFCLLFIGIDFMREGMAALGERFTPESLPSGGWVARVQLVLIGAAVTVVTQSSSAGVATALAALSAGLIDYGQAAAMVIGMDVGTTATAALAALGGSVAMRRTALAHVLYNLMTAAMAFLIVDGVAALAAALTPGDGVTEPEILLVAFHTGFNVLGVVLILPFTARFARLVERLAPERREALTAGLDARLTAEPDAAADAAATTARAVRRALAAALAGALDGRPPPREALERVRAAIDAAQQFVAAAAAPAATAAAQRRLAACLHALDHLDRLARRAAQEGRLAPLRADPALARMARVLRSALDAPQGLRGDAGGDARGDLGADAGRLARVAALLARAERLHRGRMMAGAASGAVSPDDAERRLDAGRWLQRVAHHLWRIAAHLESASGVGMGAQACAAQAGAAQRAAAPPQ